MQIGLPQVRALAANRMPNRWVAHTHSSATLSAHQTASVVHDLAEMPFASQSLDLIVLPHVLEFSSAPHQVLREVERVLIPEGRLIICGFNPASLWGVRQITGRWSSTPYLPREGEFISLLRLKDWLKLMNLEVSAGHFGCYAPPCRSEKWLQRFNFLEKAGARWWPFLGAVYIIEAVKRVQGIRLVGPVWSKQSAAAAQPAAVTNKNLQERLIANRLRQISYRLRAPGSSFLDTLCKRRSNEISKSGRHGKS